MLDKGLVLEGDLMLGLADVDLIYLRITALLCGVDRLTDRDAEAEETP